MKTRNVRKDKFLPFVEIDFLWKQIDVCVKWKSENDEWNVYLLNLKRAKGEMGKVVHKEMFFLFFPI